MATETGPDLTFAQRQVIQVTMDDSCRIHDHDGEVVYDATTHPEHASPGGGARCSIREATSGAGTTRMAENDDYYRYSHSAGIPADVDVVWEGYTLEVLTSRRDSQLPGRTFIVRGIKYATMLVSRTLLLESDDPSRVSGDGGWE